MAVDPNIKKKADDIRNKVYGREVRESLASGLEEMSSDVVENEVRQSVVESRQDNVESQWQAVSDEMTDKDVISAPEIIAARDGEANLKARLDKEHQEVTAQLAHTWKSLESFPRLSTENDDTGRIKRLIEATNVGETAFIPYQEEWYDISDTIVIDKRINVIIKGKIGYSGVRDRSAIKLDRLNGMYFELYRIADDNIDGYHGWENINYVGVEGVNLKWCTIKIYEIRNFTTGFKGSADGGSGYWFNKHYLLNGRDNLRHIEINSNGAGSWFNANYFYETSVNYNLSNTNILNDNRMKYGILQTLTNGNEYGGNSNIFYDFKFETNQDVPHGFTQIKTVLARNWCFENYRQELNGANIDLLEVDLSHVDEDVITSGAHSRGITLKPFSTVGDSKNIKFTNTDKARTHYPAIASFDNWEDNLHTKLVLNNLQKQARKTTNNELVIPNLTFTVNANEDVHNERISNYGGRIEKDHIHVGSSYPLLVYIENIKKGDTFVIEMDSHNDALGNFGIEAFRSTGEKIEGTEVDGVRPIAFLGYFSSSDLRLRPSEKIRKYQFTVNADFVDTIRLNFSGTLNNIRIKTDNEKAIVKTTQKDVKPNKIYFNSKPSLTVEGGFEVGDTVYSQDENIGWSLENNDGLLEWVEFNY